MDREPLRDTNVRGLESSFPDENSCGAPSFQDLAHAFGQRITELQQLMCLRIEDHAKRLFVADLQGLEASVHALEKVFKDIREHLAREAAAIPKARPQTADEVGGRRRDAAAGGAAAAVAAATAAPRWYVTQAELASLAAYMRGRLTLDKVNAALDEAALHAEQIARWMAAARAHALQRVPAEERKRASELYHSLSGKEGVRGQFWFTEAELRIGSALRPDKTGKALLMVLRHLGRLSEVRANVEPLGGPLIVYVLPRPGE